MTAEKAAITSLDPRKTAKNPRLIGPAPDTDGHIVLSTAMGEFGYCHMIAGHGFYSVGIEELEMSKEKIFHRMILIALALMMVAPLVYAQDEEDMEGEPPVEEGPKIPKVKVPALANINISPIIIRDGVRGSLAASVDWLLRKCETNYMGFAQEPITTRKVIGWKEKQEYQIKYRKEEYDHPIYENIYETYETFAVGGGSSTEARKLGKVKRKRIVGRKLIRKEKRTRLVRDKKGAVVKTYYKNVGPIYGEGRDIWPNGFLGANAVALLALSKSGVPEGDPVFDVLARELLNILQMYGLPDKTWDVAWLSAAFANLKGRQYVKVRDRLISKLLDGQITEGAARGLWGPVCINTTLLPAMLAYEEQINKERNVIKGAIKKRGVSKARQKKLDEIERHLEEYTDSYRWVTQQGLRFENSTKAFDLKLNEGTPPVNIRGLPYYLYNQTVGDMQSTFWATFAIREAKENGCLPDQTIRFEISKNRPVMPPEQTGKVLARLASALGSRQKVTGAWDEANTHQTIAHFVALGLPRLKDDWLFDLDSAITPLSTAQGYAALQTAAQIVGMKKFSRKYGQTIIKGRKAQISAAEDFLRTNPSEARIGRQLDPCDTFLAFTGIQKHYSGGQEDRRDLWLKLAYHLVLTQNPDGSWGKERTIVAIEPSGLWEWKRNYIKTRYEKAQAKLPEAKRKQFDEDAYWRRYILWGSYIHKAGLRYHGYYHLWKDVLMTAYSTIFLADGSIQPGAGYIQKTGRRLPRTLGKAIEILAQREKKTVNCMGITSEVNAQDLEGLPVVMLGADEDLSDSKLADIIHSYLQSGGTVLVEMADPVKSKSVQRKLAGMVGSARAKDIPPDVGFMRGFKGTKPKARGLLYSDNRVAVVYMPVVKTLPGAMTFAQAVQLTMLVIKDKAGPKFFDNAYAWRNDGIEASAFRIKAISALQTVQSKIKRASGGGGTEHVAADAELGVVIDQNPDDEEW